MKDFKRLSVLKVIFSNKKCQNTDFRKEKSQLEDVAKQPLLPRMLVKGRETQKEEYCKKEENPPNSNHSHFLVR